MAELPNGGSSEGVWLRARDKLTGWFRVQLLLGLIQLALGLMLSEAIEHFRASRGATSAQDVMVLVPLLVIGVPVSLAASWVHVKARSVVAATPGLRYPIRLGVWSVLVICFPVVASVSALVLMP
jgi:hypothetical protein